MSLMKIIVSFYLLFCHLQQHDIQTIKLHSVKSVVFFNIYIYIIAHKLTLRIENAFLYCQPCYI